MKIDINSVFDQIVKIQINSLEIHRIKDIELDLKDEYEYDITMSYVEAYDYLCDCLLIDEGDSNTQKIVDLFLIHQYLCYCYLSKGTIEKLFHFADDWNKIMDIVKECFSVNRVLGAFQACINQYEILEKSNIWQKFSRTKKMQIMKETAKSYRNIGDFYNALKLYYDCLKLNPEKDWLQRVELLLKIGKVYRHYLMQVELARFFVEEAYAILNKNGMHSLNDKKQRRYAVICLDTLGQIYRDEQEYEKAEAFFQESEKLYGKKEGRARIHETLMKYQKDIQVSDSDLSKDIEFLVEVITNLEKNPTEEVGVGIRSVQLGHLKFMDKLREKGEAYQEVYKGRRIAYKYNDIRTVIRSYMQEAYFLKQEERYADYIRVSKVAVRLASDSNQLVLENRIIKDIITSSYIILDIIDSTTKVELVKRCKDIYEKLVKSSKFSIDIVQNAIYPLFSENKLIDIYGIVVDDFEHMLNELNIIIEILNIEIDKISQKYINTEIAGFTYKSILHKFKNDLPDETTINHLRTLCDNIQANQPEYSETLSEANKQLETFSHIIAHIKQSASEALVESEYEKEWCSLDSLIQTGIQNFIYLKPQYKKIIHYDHTEYNIEILVQSTLFETIISEIINNAFNYAKSMMGEKDIIEKFHFFINLEIMEKRVVVLACYSRYWDNETAVNAGISIKRGMEHEKLRPREGSRYGFQSMKFLFEDLMDGKIRLLQKENKVGICIQMPISPTLRIAERNKIYG